MIKNLNDYRKIIQKTLTEERIWDLSDKVLYDMCKNYPYHRNSKEIIMKTLIIGRVYSVQLERRKNKNNQIGDRFYEKQVIPMFRNSSIDKRIERLKSKKLSEDCLSEIFETHKYLMDTIHEITDMDKRSFCSKYLHFHLPKLFFLYDSRLCQSVSLLKGKIQKDQKDKFLDDPEDYDKTYVEFFLKCYNLKLELEKFVGRKLKIREFDNIMIEISNSVNEMKRTSIK